MILADMVHAHLVALSARLLDALDVDGPRMRVYLAHSANRAEYPWNVDCSICLKGPVKSIDVRPSTISMASTPGLGNEKARAHLAETHGYEEENR